VVSCVTALTRKRLVKIPLWTALLFPMAFLFFVACSSSDPPDSTVSLESLSGTEIVSRASDALAGVTTFRFALSHDEGDTILANGIVVQKVTGTAVTPDSYTLDADTLVAGFFVNTQVIVIDQDTYMTNPITRVWQQLEPGTSPFGSFNPALLVAGVLSQIENPVPGSPTNEGEYVVTGTLPAIALKSLTGGVNESAPDLDVRVTVDGDSFAPVEARITGRATSSEPGDLVRTVRLFEFNTAITIEPPN
jgi:hypothetical protein